MNVVNFAVISVTKNDSHSLVKTRKSIECQSYSNWIHIIIDGDSDSSHLETLQDLNLRKSIFLSEPDSGIYDAMNKGLRLVPDDYYVVFLNSGDELISPQSLEIAAESLLNSDCPAFLYSDFEQIDTSSGTWITKFVARPNIYNQLYAYGYMSHQATILRIDLLRKLNGFNMKFKVAADWDLLVRALNITTPVKMPAPLARFYTGGYSSQNIKSAHSELKYLRKVYLPRSATSRLYEYIWELVYLDFLKDKKLIIILKFLLKLLYRPASLMFKLLLIDTFNFLLQGYRKLNENYANSEKLTGSNLKIVVSSMIKTPVIFMLQLGLLAQRALYLFFIDPILKFRLRLAFEVEPQFRVWLNRKLGLSELHNSSGKFPR